MLAAANTAGDAESPTGLREETPVRMGPLANVNLGSCEGHGGLLGETHINCCPCTARACKPRSSDVKTMNLELPELLFVDSLSLKT